MAKPRPAKELQLWMAYYQGDVDADWALFEDLDLAIRASLENADMRREMDPGEDFLVGIRKILVPRHAAREDDDPGWNAWDAESVEGSLELTFRSRDDQGLQDAQYLLAVGEATGGLLDFDAVNWPKDPEIDEYLQAQTRELQGRIDQAIEASNGGSASDAIQDMLVILCPEDGL